MSLNGTQTTDIRNPSSFIQNGFHDQRLTLQAYQILPKKNIPEYQIRTYSGEPLLLTDNLLVGICNTNSYSLHIHVFGSCRSFCIGYRMQNLDIHLSTKETNSDILRDIEYK